MRGPVNGKKGKCRRGSNAPQYNVCCFDSAILAQSIAMGHSSLQSSKVNSTGHVTCSISDASTPRPGGQSVKEQPATQGAGEDGDEEQKKVSEP